MAEVALLALVEARLARAQVLDQLLLDRLRNVKQRAVLEALDLLSREVAILKHQVLVLAERRVLQPALHVPRHVG